MGSELLIPSVRPGDLRWRVKVLVLEKSNVTSPKAGKRLQKLILMDKEGNKVEGNIWDANTDIFRNTLSLFRTYYVGGAIVSSLKEGYADKYPGVTHQWSINRPTYIKQIDDMANTIPYPNVPYVSCTQIIEAVGTGKRVDLFAVVIDVKQPKEITFRGKVSSLQECTIIQQELRPMVLTLWGNFIDIQGVELFDKKDSYTIILGRNLIPSTFTGPALATTPVSTIAVDPDIPQTLEFRSWLTDNMTVIKNMEKSPTRETFQGLMAFSPNQPILKVADITPDRKNPWVKICITVDRTRQSLTYTACPKCRYMITADPGEIYFCFTCSSNQVAEIRCKLNATVGDDSDTAKVTLFDEIAEQLIGKKKLELHAMTAEETHQLLEQTNTRFQDRPFHMQLRLQRNNEGLNTAKYTVQQIHFGNHTDPKDGDKEKSAEHNQVDGGKVITEKAASQHLVLGTEGTLSTTAPEETEKDNTATATKDTSSDPISPLKKMKVGDS